MPFLKQSYEHNNFLEVFLRQSERYRPLVELLDNIILNLDELSWADAELLMAEISQINRSGFCTGIHQGVAQALDANNEKSSDDKFVELLNFAKKLNLDASLIDISDIQSIRKAGWSDETIEDVIGLVAVIRVYNTLANGMGFKAVSKPEFFEMGKETVASKGFLPQFNSYLQLSTGKAT